MKILNKKKILIVTGGSRGIGYSTCLNASKKGFSVAINYNKDENSAKNLASTINNNGGNAIILQADVRKEEEIVNMFEEVSNKIGYPTALVNSAGIAGHQLIQDLDKKYLQDLFEINVFGTMICCREACKRMSTSNGGLGGSIVNVSSMASSIGGRPGNCPYAASKGAIDVFTIGLAKEVATEGIRVNCVGPGVTLTDMTSDVRDKFSIRKNINSTIAMNRTAEAHEIALPILWLISSEASFISGCSLDASGGGFVIGASTKDLS